MSERSDRVERALDELEAALREGWPENDPQVRGMVDQAIPMLRMWSRQPEPNLTLMEKVDEPTESTPTSPAPATESDRGSDAGA